MRVMYLSADPGVPVLGHKGASVHVRELTRALLRAGAEVVVAAPRIEPEGDYLDGPAALAAITPVLPRRLPTEDDVREAMDAQAAEVLALARERSVDAVYERFSLFSDAGVRTAAQLGVPHVLEMNSPLRDEARRFRTLPHPTLAHDVERTVLAATSRVLVVSPPLAEHARRHGAAAVDVVPNGVAAEVPASDARREGFTAGFAGSLKAWHGIEVLAEAAELAPAVAFEVVGEGPLAHVLEGTRVRHVGALPHRETLTRIATWHAGLAPYLPLDDFYFSPLKVLEYMAAGVCPVASALGELPGLLGDGERGILVPPGDAPALAAALTELAADRNRAHVLGAAAREHVLAHRSWDSNARRVLDALTAAEAVSA